MKHKNPKINYANVNNAITSWKNNYNVGKI